VEAYNDPESREGFFFGQLEGAVIEAESELSKEVQA